MNFNFVLNFNKHIIKVSNNSKDLTWWYKITGEKAFRFCTYKILSLYTCITKEITKLQMLWIQNNKNNKQSKLRINHKHFTIKIRIYFELIGGK